MIVTEYDTNFYIEMTKLNEQLEYRSSWDTRHL